MQLPELENRSVSVNEFGWEETNCPLCHSTEHEVFLESSDRFSCHASNRIFAVVQCSKCSMLFTNPRPDSNSISLFYPTHYNPHQKKRAKDRTLANWYPKKQLELLRKQIESTRKPRLLDFGCGSGRFAIAMANAGWEVAVIDPSIDAIASIDDDRIDAVHGSLPNSKFEPQQFDVITAWHVLEHLHDPVTCMDEFFRLLRPGGSLFLAVPNIESWPARWFGKDWFGLDVPRHLSHFSPETLRHLIRATGFQLDCLSLVRYPDWLRSSAKLSRERSGARLGSIVLKGRFFARIASTICYLANQADAMLAVAHRPLDA
jgi:2-polyprenyl-3-methyl-5-hydroxy-6-metoxy-1,4-benzoquinol methylase